MFTNLVSTLFWALTLLDHFSRSPYLTRDDFANYLLNMNSFLRHLRPHSYATNSTARTWWRHSNFAFRQPGMICEATYGQWMRTAMRFLIDFIGCRKAAIALFLINPCNEKVPVWPEIHISKISQVIFQVLQQYFKNNLMYFKDIIF